MRHIVYAFLLMAACALPARADEAAVRSVISDQIEAFRADDFATAFTFASPAIRRLFGTPDIFGQMVRQGYPMVWRPADIRFLSLESRGGEMVQTVLVEDGQGVRHVLEYRLIDTEAGWKIDAVRLLDPGIGAV